MTRTTRQLAPAEGVATSQATATHPTLPINTTHLRDILNTPPFQSGPPETHLTHLANPNASDNTKNALYCLPPPDQPLNVIKYSPSVNNTPTRPQIIKITESHSPYRQTQKPHEHKRKHLDMEIHRTHSIDAKTHTSTQDNTQHPTDCNL